MRIRFAWRTMQIGRCKGFAPKKRKTLAPEQREMGMKALDFMAFALFSTHYNKLIQAKKCEKVVLKSHQDYNKAYHLNTVNGLHSRLKDMLYRYRGVSSKYLNRYLALFTALEYVGRSLLTPDADSIRQLIAGVSAGKPIRSLSSEGILAF